MTPDPVSVSRRMVTICTSVNELFLMTALSKEVIFSNFNWSEKQPAGQFPHTLNGPHSAKDCPIFGFHVLA